MISAVSAAAGLVLLAPIALRPRVDPTQPAASQPPAGKPASASLDDLGIVSRAEWGARQPDLVSSNERPFNASTNPSGWRVYDGSLEEALNTIIVHHSALPLSDGPREIQALHMDEKRFADVGYHFMIDREGRVYEGRPIYVRGAHTAGHNTGAIGVMLMGNFEEIEPSQEQLQMLEALAGHLAGQYTIENLAGHRDYNEGLTLCPGENLEALLPALAERLNLRYGV